MDLIQFISFILVMLAMSLLSRKRAKEKQQAQFPETKDEDGHKQKDNLKKFLKSLDIDMQEDEEHEAPPPPKIQPTNSFQAPPPAPMQPQSRPAQPSHRLVKESTYRFQDRLDDYSPANSIETKKWQTSIDNRPISLLHGKLLVPICNLPKSVQICNLPMRLPIKWWQKIMIFEAES